MSGGIKKTEIVEADLVALAEEIHKVGVEMQALLDILGKKPPKVEGLSGLKKETEELTFNEAELAKQHQELGKLTAKLEEIKSSYNKEIIKTKLLIAQENEVIKESITGKKAEAKAVKDAVETKKLKAAEDRKAAQAAKLSTQEEKLKIAVEAQAIGSIRRLQAENKLHAFAIKNKLNPAIASERDEILRLNKVIGSNKDSISKMQHEQVTAWNRVTMAVMQHLAAYIGFQQLIQIAKNIFTTTKELDSLNYAITSVITNQADLSNSQQFLSRITEAYGAELVSTTERYIKFYAAAKQSKTSLQDTQKIFESVTKVAATLGLKTDELTGIYLALEQMMSKGCHSKGSLLLLADGTEIKVEDIIVGMFLMGEDFQPKEVLAIASGTDEMYKILPIGKPEFTVNKNHIMPMLNVKSNIIENIKIADYLVNNCKSDFRILDAYYNRYKFNISLSNEINYYGIELNGNHLYLSNSLIINHNTVTAEELRRQLGERVPGAVAILARSMGVSTAKLSDMMKKGQVLSAEVLPKFAEELEKTFGVENVHRIDTMQTSMARITLEWQSFIKQIEGSKTFTTVLNKISEFLDFYVRTLDDSFETYSKQDEFTKTATKNVDKLIKTYETLTINVNLTKDEQSELTSVTNQLAASFGTQSGVITKFDQYGNALKIDTGLIHAIITETRGMNNEMKKSAIEDETKKISELNVEYKRLQDVLMTGKNSGVPVLNSVIEKLPTKIKDIGTQIKAAQDRISILRGLISSPTDETIPFNVDTFEKEIDAVKDTYADFNKVVNGGASTDEQKYLIEKSKVLKTGFKTEKEYLNNLLIEYKDNIDARIVIFNRLGEIEKKEEPGKKNAGKTKLQLAKESAEKELAEFKREEQLKLAEQSKASNELIENDDDLKAALEEQKYESDQRIIAEEIRLQEELLKLTKEGSTERASIESEIAKIKENAAQSATDRTVDLVHDEIAARKKALAQQKKDIDDASKQLLSDTENNIIKEQTILTKKAGQDIKDAKGNSKKTKEIKDNLVQDMLNVELMYRKDVNNNDKLIGSDKQTNLDRIVDIEKNNEEQKLKRSEDVENAIYEVKQQIYQKSAELINAGFDLIQQGYTNQLSIAEQAYESEKAAAGDNITERIIAERKFEKEKKRIARNQAIAEKAQAAFSIALSTAQAIIAVWANPLTLVGAPALTALIAALGAVQLASVLSQPIPAYADGVEDFKGGLAVLGDGTGSKKGKELVIEPSGKKWLSSDMPSLYNIPKGSDVIPADETSKMLANMAFNQVRETLDIAETNKYLSGIEKNTRNNSSSYIDSKGRTVIKRGTVNSIL